MTNLDNLISTLSNLRLENQSNSTQSNNSETIMSLSAAKEIAHTLRTFSGRSEHLEYFINSVDTFYNRYAVGTTDESLKEFVHASIVSKLIDEAGDFIFCRPDLKSWPDIKNALRIKFGDKTDRNVLLQQLNFLCKNRNESSLEFIERLKTLLSRINIKIHADPNLTNGTKTALVSQAEATAITVLMANVPSELRTILMIHNPKSLEDANTLVFNHALIEQQINSRMNIPRGPPNIFAQTSNLRPKPQNNHMPFINPVSNFPQPTFNRGQSSFMPPQQYFPQNRHENSTLFRPQQHFSGKQTFPSQPINIQPRPIRHHFPTNQQVFGKPKDVFSRENSHKPTEKPVPMSTTSRIPSLQTRNINANAFPMNANRKPSYTFTELTNLDEGNYYSENQEDRNSAYNPYIQNVQTQVQPITPNNYTDNQNELDDYYYYQNVSIENPIHEELEQNQIYESQSFENFQNPASENNPS